MSVAPAEPAAPAKPAAQAPSAEQAKPPVPPTPDCGTESKCKIDNTTEPVCFYDDSQGCIRRYESKCHLEFAACKLGKGEL